MTDVCAFLGFCNYHRKFIKDYASLAEPLVALTRGHLNFKWTNHEDVAFEELRMALLNAPMLLHPDANGVFVLDTDASDWRWPTSLSPHLVIKTLWPETKFWMTWRI